MRAAKHLVLVACAAKKGPEPAPAGDLYRSDLFNKASAWAKRHGDAWRILSAEHGLLDPAQVIAPYDRTLAKMHHDARREWARSVRYALADMVERGELASDARITILAGVRYRYPIEAALRARGHDVQVPLEGLGIGQQKKWLKFNMLKQLDLFPGGDDEALA